MKCPYCEGQLDSHDAACPLHPDKIEQNDLRMLYESNSGFALHVRQVRALERIAQHPGGAPRRYAAECSRTDRNRAEIRTVRVLMLISAYDTRDVGDQLALQRTIHVRSICPWDPRVHGPWADSPEGLWEQDPSKIPNTPVTP